MVVLLIKKIAELFIVMLLGFVLVKAKILRTKDSTVLSKLALYVLMPCMILGSFNVSLSGDIKSGLLLALGASVIFQAVMLLGDFLYARIMKPGPAERGSAMYSNAGNLIIPLVTAMLGEEWLVYSMPFLAVQLVFLWTHGIRLFDSDSKFSLKKILLNINFIALGLGLIVFFAGIKVPQFVGNIVSELGSMIGYVGMLVCGMLAADIKPKQVFGNKRLYLPLLIRMVIMPVLTLLIIKLLPLHKLIPNGENILLVTYLATTSPTAATIMQFAQIHGKDADLAAAENIATTIVCIVTMPAFVWLYLNI